MVQSALVGNPFLYKIFLSLQYLEAREKTIFAILKDGGRMNLSMNLSLMDTTVGILGKAWDCTLPGHILVELSMVKSEIFLTQ